MKVHNVEVQGRDHGPLHPAPPAGDVAGRGVRADRGPAHAGHHHEVQLRPPDWRPLQAGLVGVRAREGDGGDAQQQVPPAPGQPQQDRDWSDELEQCGDRGQETVTQARNNQNSTGKYLHWTLDI